MIRDTSAQDSAIQTIPGWRHKKRLTIVCVMLALLIGAGVLLNQWRNSSQSISLSRVKIAAVSRGNLVRDVSVNGRLVAAVSPTLYSTAPSTVTFKVKAGDTIQKGQVVAELESPDLSNQLQREQALFEQLEAEVARQKILARKQKLLARRDADQAEIERVSAERTYQRIEKVGVSGIVAKIDFLKAQDALKSAEIRAKHAEQAANLDVEDVDLNLKTKISQLQQQKLVRDNAQRKVDELKLRAPVDGVVGTLSVANRSVVAPNTALMTLVDLSQLEVELAIPETYVADLGIGLNAELILNDKKVTGRLSAISPEVVNNQVLARVRFSGEQPAGLRQSQRVSARLLIEEKPNVLILPRGPFVESGGGRYVYLVEGGVARRHAIKMGATSIAAVEILEGLKVGDQVVIAGSDLFENAVSVSLNN